MTKGKAADRATACRRDRAAEIRAAARPRKPWTKRGGGRPRRRWKTSRATSSARRIRNWRRCNWAATIPAGREPWPWGRRWDATILAHVAVGRSIKSATGRDKIRGDKVGQRHGRAPVVAAADRNVVPQANWIDLDRK